jgi:hypothetical protein
MALFRIFYNEWLCGVLFYKLLTNFMQDYTSFS